MAKKQQTPKADPVLAAVAVGEALTAAAQAQGSTEKVEAPILTGPEQSDIMALAQDLCSADKVMQSKLAVVAEGVAKHLDPEATFGVYKAVRDCFVLGYAKARGCTAETAQNRWSAILAVLEAEYSWVPPKSESKAAVDKQAQRSAKADELAATMAQCDSAPDALKKAAVALEAGDIAKAAQFNAAAVKMKKDADEAARKQNSTAVADATKRLREAMKDCKDAGRIMLAVRILEGEDLATLLATVLGNEKAKAKKAA